MKKHAAKPLTAKQIQDNISRTHEANMMETCRDLRRRMKGHTDVNGIAVVVLTARELEDLLDYIHELENRLMPQVRTIEVLRAARKLVANEKTWCMGYFAKNEHGTGLSADQVDRGVQFCAMGAIAKSMRQFGINPHDNRNPDGRRGWNELWVALDVLAVREIGANGGIADANDNFGRIAALSVIDAAISELVQRGEG